MNTEKISVNVNIVDLGRMDVLIEKGLYGNRSDFMNKAVHNELLKNESILESTIEELNKDTHIVIGIARYNAEYFAKIAAKGEIIKLFVIGMLVIGADVPIELAKRTISSIRVFGSCKIPGELKEYYNISSKK